MPIKVITDLRDTVTYYTGIIVSGAFIPPTGDGYMFVHDLVVGTIRDHLPTKAISDPRDTVTCYTGVIVWDAFIPLRGDGYMVRA